MHVLGDSHTRSFANNDNYIPIFIGPGKTVNFTTNELAERTKNRIQKLLRTFNSRSMLILGEPDTRWAAGRGWHPWKHKGDPNLPKDSIKYSITRYCKTLKALKSHKIAVFNVNDSNRSDQNQFVHIWNNEIGEFCKSEGIQFVHTNQLFLDEPSLISEYLADPIHMDFKIAQEVDKILGLSGKTRALPDYNKTKKLFSYNAKFGCYTLKP